VTLFIVLLVIFFAVFTQSLTGFGSALVAMALLPEMIGIRSAAPLVALVQVTIELFLLFRYRSAFNLHSVWRLTLASIFGIPFGILALRQADERLVLGFLGVVLAGYSLYGLLNLKLPALKEPAWAFGFGFLAGILGGAYNTSGPPAILYGNCRRWEPAEFKSNLSGFFLLIDTIVVTGHAWSRNLTPAVLQHYLWALPVIGLGLLAGIGLDRFLSPEVFRKVVLGLLVVMGLRLLFTLF
jgi:uncharacterized membrane protein YfcA